MQITETPIFPNFLYTATLDINNDRIATYILELEKRNSGRSYSNGGGWQDDISTVEDTDLNKLKFQCREICQEISNSWNLNKTLKIKNVWANINRENNFNYPHFHPQSLFSGVYYVKTEENSGDLVIKRPDIQEHYIDEADTEYTQKHFNISPKNGQLIIFPSYLNHFVEQNLSTSYRISIAMNFDGYINNG
jgi:uncharacterized protein (TIGR02466 family)